MRRFKCCSRCVGDSRWWRSLTFPAGNKAKRLSSVNHTTKIIHHRHKMSESVVTLSDILFGFFCFIFVLFRRFEVCSFSSFEKIDLSFCFDGSTIILTADNVCQPFNSYHMQSWQGNMITIELSKKEQNIIANWCEKKKLFV